MFENIKNDEKVVMAINELVTKFPDKEITTNEFVALLADYDMCEGSAIPSDYCYNIVNRGIYIDSTPTVLEFVKPGLYICRGENYNYNGPIKWKNKRVGEGINGKRIIDKEYIHLFKY